MKDHEINHVGILKCPEGFTVSNSSIHTTQGEKKRFRFCPGCGAALTEGVNLKIIPAPKGGYGAT